MEHYLKLKRWKIFLLFPLIVGTEAKRLHYVLFVFFLSDGWVQDRKGQWVKDENVEFDSDEEEPAPLVPLSTS